MALGNNPTQLEVVKAIKDLENKPSDDTWRAIYVNGVKYKSNSILGGDLDFRNGDNVTAKIGAKGVTLGVASGYSIPSTTKQSEWDAKADTSDIPTNTSDLTNDSGFITGISSSDVTTALGYTPYNASNPNGYTSNTGTVTSVGAGTGLSISGTASVNPTVNVASGYKLPTTTEWNAKANTSSIPTKTSQLTNDSGFISTNSISNPNLLINSNFAINQRNGYIFRGTALFYSDAGLTNQIGYTDARVGYVTVESISGNAANITISYTPDNGSSWITGNGYVSLSSCTSGYTGGRYSVDRFYLVGNSATLTPTANGITIVSGGSWQGINQEIEDYSKLKGQTLVLSIKIAITNGNGTFVMGIRDNKGVILESFKTATTTKGIFTAQTTIPNDWSGTRLYVFVWSRYASQTIEIDWVKLEIGSIATEYTPPLIAEELLKCYRYYQKYNYSTYTAIAIGIAYNSTTKLELPFMYRQEMRTTPTAKISGNFRVYNTNVYKTDITLALNFANNKAATLLATSASGGFTNGNSYIVGPNGDTTASISLDAEL